MQPLFFKIYHAKGTEEEGQCGHKRRQALHKERAAHDAKDEPPDRDAAGGVELLVDDCVHLLANRGRLVVIVKDCGVVDHECVEACSLQLVCSKLACKTHQVFIV